MLTWDDIKNTSKENAWKMLYSAGQTFGTPIAKSLAKTSEGILLNTNKFKFKK